MPMRNIQFCESCVISSPNLQVETGRVCNRTRTPVKDTDFCNYHTKNLWICDCCGKQFWQDPIINMELNTNDSCKIDSLICPTCMWSLNTCHTCRYGEECSFETDPSPLEKMVQKQVRQGNMIAVTQVMNPERIRITCEKNCHCYHDFLCSKQNHGTCPQYQMNRV